MRVARYRLILCLQFLLLAIDLVVNSFSGLFATEDVVLLVLYIVQDASLVFEIIILFLLFFNTYVFRAGLVTLLIRKFKSAIVLCFVYLTLCLVYHIWTLKLQWGSLQLFIITCICGRYGSLVIRCITGTPSGYKQNLQENDELEFMFRDNLSVVDILRLSVVSAHSTC
ncbi:transmembrane protein 138-like [Corticium candelabrum]|uniref:transmembrane protein 138-like n=1 Tax=Corticium candelabrum TaxID=121492 RepID=UPI002E25A48B|nr:transmembrane protein 138-like [Corticium candelabrum]